jgi:hypothetical protein
LDFTGPAGIISGYKFDAPVEVVASTTPNVLLTDDHANAGEARILLDGDAAGPDSLLDLQVDVAGTLTTYVQLDGVSETIDLSYPLVSASNVTTTGTLRGKVNIVVTTGDTDSPTAGEMLGTLHIADNATAANDVDYTLPTAVLGMSACFYDNGGGDGGIIIDASAGDEILLNGTGVGVADAIDSPGVAGAGANGDYICITAIDATSWVTLDFSGTWVDGGAD